MARRKFQAIRHSLKSLEDTFLTRLNNSEHTFTDGRSTYTGTVLGRVPFLHGLIIVNISIR